MKKLLFLTGMILYSCMFFAQYYSVIPASVSVADAAVSDTSNYVSYNNPAVIAFKNHLQAGMTVENKYLLKELMMSSLYLTLPMKYFQMTFNLLYSGFSVFHEWMYGIHFSKSFENKLSVGVQFNYYSFYSQLSNKYFGKFFPQVGLIYFPDKKWTLGFQVFNPLQEEIIQESYSKKIPAVYQFGTSYCIQPGLFWRSQISGEVSSGFSVSSGFDYLFTPEIVLKGGILWGDFLVPDLGLSYKWEHLEFHLHSRIHPLLGLNPISSVIYRL